MPGGAHRNPYEQAQILKKELISNLETLNSLTSESLKNIRNEKYLNITSAN